jgi:hypothetical protein
MGSPAQPGTSPFQVLAWLLFTGFDVLILIYVIALTIAQPQNWDFLTLDRDTVAYISATFRLLGMISVGLGILTIAISTTISGVARNGPGMHFGFSRCFSCLQFPPPGLGSHGYQSWSCRLLRC